jgi:inner membrane protein
MNNEQWPQKRMSGPNQQSIKLAIIGFIILVLLIPIIWIGVLANERNQRKEGVVREIAGKWGDAQVVSGPFISVPYGVSITEFSSDRQAVKRMSTRYLHFAPENLIIDGNIQAVTHKRGIYKVSGYKAELDFEADFSACSLENPVYADLDLRWDEAVVSFDLQDQRGLKNITANINDEALVFNRSDGILSISRISGDGASGEQYAKQRYHSAPSQTDFKLAAKMPLDCRASDMKLKIHLSISGTQMLSFSASALTEKISLNGDWPSPSFIGDMLPDKREVDARGFSATWQQNSLNSGIKKTWTSEEPLLQLSNMGVEFLIMVDSYRQTTRSLKYSVLFLLLTFLTFFFAEVMSKQKIHPVQYIMVGFGLVLFYLLLLSLSEHIAFVWAYLIAATGVVLQISMYCFSILKSRKFALRVGALLSILYVLLYLLLRLQDNALLIGSVSLFILLSVAMYVIRNVNWYSTD